MLCTFRRMCAVSDIAVFCSSLIPCFPVMLLRYFMNYFEMVQVVPCIIPITFVFIFQMRCISIVRSLYFRIFSVAFHITFLSPEIATSINIKYMFLFHYHGLWCLVYCYGWFCRFALVDSTIWLPCLLDLFLLILVHADTSVLCPILHLFPCICCSEINIIISEMP